MLTVEQSENGTTTCTFSYKNLETRFSHAACLLFLTIMQPPRWLSGRVFALHSGVRDSIDLPPIKRSALGFLFYHNLYHVIPDITPKVNKSVQLMSPAFISKTVTDDVHLLLVLLYLYHMRIEYIVFFQIWKIIFNKRALWIGHLVAYVTVANKSFHLQRTQNNSQTRHCFSRLHKTLYCMLIYFF